MASFMVRAKDPVDLVQQGYDNDPYYDHIIFKRLALNDTGLFHPYWLSFQPPNFLLNVFMGLLVAVTGIMSVLGNGMVIYTFMRSVTLRSQKLFITNLALSDFLSPLLTYHMFTISSFEGIWSFSIWACKYYALIQGWLGIVSIVSLSAVATERYMAMMNPHGWKDIGMPKKLICTVFIWLYSFLVVCPPLFGMGKYVAAGYLTTCCFDYIDRSPSTTAFIMYLFVFGLVLPMAVIIIAYVKIWLAVKASVASRAAETTIEMETFDLRSSRTPALHTNLKGKDVRTAKLILLVIAVFVIAWTPYAMVALLGQMGPVGSVTPLMVMIPAVFAKASTLYNPVLYSFKDSRFKRAVRKYICSGIPSHIRTDSTTTRT